MGSRRSRGFDLALVVAFCLALAAPAVDSILRPGARADVRVEEREPAPFPAFDGSVAALNAWPAGVESWYSDALGLRDVLLRAQARSRFALFGVSPSSRAVLGEDGWIFLAARGILDAERGALPLTTERLALWQRTLESRRDVCERAGAEFLFVLAPEKSSIYPEKLPRGYARRGPRPLDQLVAWLAAHSSVRVLDLRDVELAEKARDTADDPAYFPYGPHWTDRGLYAAYVRVLDALRGRFPALEPVPASALHWEFAPNEGDSWAARLRLDGVLRQRPIAIREIEGGYDCELGRSDRQQTIVWARGPDPRAPRLVFFHDSFGDRMRKLLVPHFSDSYLCWRDGFDPAAIVRERPDVVVQLYAERLLWNELPVPVRAPGDRELERAFDAACESVFVLDPRAEPPRVTAVGKTKLAPGADGLVVEQLAGTDMLELPDFPFAPGRRYVLRVDVESAAASWIDVGYRTARDPRYRRGQTFSGATTAGRAVVFIEMNEGGVLGPLRVRLGRGPGRFVVRALEVRALDG